MREKKNQNIIEKFCGFLFYFDDKLVSLEKLLLVIVLIIMTFAVTLQIIFRPMGRSLRWSNELTRHLFLVMVLLGSSIGVKEHAHIGTEYFIKKLPPSIYRICQYISTIAFALFAISLIYYGWQQTMTSFGIRQTLITLPFPKYYFYGSAPVVGTFILYHLIIRIIKGEVGLITTKL